MWYAIPVVSFIGLLFIEPMEAVLALGGVVAVGLGAIKLMEWMRR